jgi:hypothetical protein
MLRIFTYLIGILIFATSCQPNSTLNDNDINSHGFNILDSSSTLNGYWILTDYFDNILVNKSIAKNRLHKISWTMFAFEIKKDSLRALGLIYPETSYKINTIKDTILKFKEFGDFILYKNNNKNYIFANQINANSLDTLNIKTYRFRKISENNLIELISKKNPFDIREGFTKIFRDSIIVGEYLRIDKTQSEKIQFNSDGSMTGIREFKKYNIHNYFGTLHPYKNYDEISFESDNKNVHYNWKFSGDTLMLIELLTKNGDEFYLGKESLLYRKTSKHSQ